MEFAMKSPHFHPPARGQPLPAGRPGRGDRAQAGRVHERKSSRV